MKQLSEHLKTFNSKDSVNLFENVNHADSIIFYDFNSTTKQKFNQLYDVLYSDFQNMPKQAPKVLTGGFQAWNFFVTNGFNYNDWVEIGNGIGIKPSSGTRVPPAQSQNYVTNQGNYGSQLPNQQSGVLNNHYRSNSNQMGVSDSKLDPQANQFHQPTSFIAQQINRPADLSRQNSKSQNSSPVPNNPSLNKQPSFPPPMSQLKQTSVNYTNNSSVARPNQSGFSSNINYSTNSTKLVHEPIASTTIKTYELPKSNQNNNLVSNIIQSYETETRSRSPTNEQSELEARFANLRSKPAGRSNSTKSNDQVHIFNLEQKGSS